MTIQIDVKTSGIGELLSALRVLQGKEMAKVLTAGIGTGLRKEVVPRLKAEAKRQVEHPGSHRGPAGKRGRGGPLEDKITVRKVRLRSGEVAAFTVSSRAWYAHFFTQGTRPHLIAARHSSGQRASSRAVRSFNRGTMAGAAALSFAGIYAARVDHPGSPAHDWVRSAGAQAGRRVQARVLDDIRAAVVKARSRPARTVSGSK
jgi:hypothetical protein